MIPTDGLLAAGMAGLVALALLVASRRRHGPCPRCGSRSGVVTVGPKGLGWLRCRCCGLQFDVSY